MKFLFLLLFIGCVFESEDKPIPNVAGEYSLVTRSYFMACDDGSMPVIPKVSNNYVIEQEGDSITLIHDIDTNALFITVLNFND